MRFISIILLLFALPVSIFSNELSVFNGMYVESVADNILTDDQSSRMIGNVTYQYYENEDDERILHGYFKLKESLVGDINIYRVNYGGVIKNLTINGQYVDDLKSGEWKISAIVDNNNSSKNYNNIRYEIIASYLEGKLNGKVTSTGVDLETKKNIFSSTAIFKNNKRVGKYLYSDIRNQIFIDLTFDDNGYYDGDYSVKFNNYNVTFFDKRQYKNGVLQKRLFRNMNNGNIISKYDISNPEKTIKNEDEFQDSKSNEDLQRAMIYWNIGDVSGSITTGHSFIYIVQRGIDPEDLYLDYEIVSEQGKTQGQ